MVLDSSPELDAVFHSLSDATRRTMLRRLTAGSCKLSELAAPFDMSFPAASKHVRVLEAAGLVARTIQGRDHIIRIEADALRQAQAWLAFYERFWTDRLDALDAVLKENRKDTP